MADMYVKALFQNFIGSSGSLSAQTYDTLPDNDDTTITCGDTADVFGAYSAIATTVGTVDIWLYGCYLTALSAADDTKIGFATGATGSESDRMTVPATRTDGTTAGQTYGVAHTIPFPIRIPSGTQLSAHGKSGTASTTVNVVTLHGISLIG